MAELFLSYGHEDISFAETLAGLLERNDLTVWWDRRMVAGANIDDVIEEELKKAKAVIVLWSRASVKSDWVRGEAQTAHELKKLVPIKIEECNLPIQYRGIHTPEVYKNRDELRQLAQMLTAKFKVPQPITQGTARGPTAQIKFTDESASNFFAKLGRQRAQYEKELAESHKQRWEKGWVTGTSRVIRKNPLGAAVSAAVAIGSTAFIVIAGVALVLLWNTIRPLIPW